MKNTFRIVFFLMLTTTSFGQTNTNIFQYTEPETLWTKVLPIPLFMKKISISLIAILAMILIGCTDNKKSEEPVTTPNIVIIYADDMGYGDLAYQNPNSKIPTPNLDKLAASAMRFTNAHSSSGICSPSRYALLTGTYHWRRQHNIVNSFGEPFFKDSDVTLPDILKEKGYKTACIGKWHLGWKWDFINEPSGEYLKRGKPTKFYTAKDLDWDRPVSGGPLDRGFDYYFGDGTINFPPYAWVENDKFIQPPTDNLESNIYPGFKVKEGSWEFRPGPMVKNWNPYEVLPTISKKTVQWIGEQNSNTPFFLYFALPSPHAPIIPNDEFDGTSDAGPYGDFMVQTDHVIGRVLEALKQNGLEENTIVIFSSDNGPEKYAFQRGENYGHFSMGDFRGLKRDVWEGGHHVPMLIKWPNRIKGGSESNALVSQIDIMATLAHIVDYDLLRHEAQDSHNLLPILKGENIESPVRKEMVHNTYENKWGLRQGDWLYINSSSGEHSPMPESFKKLRNYKDFKSEGLLFNMKNDPEQRINLFAEYPEIVKELNSELNKLRTLHNDPLLKKDTTKPGL